MAAFQTNLAAAQQPPSSNNTGVAIRGASRALSSALRSAGISTDSAQPMDLDGGVSRTGRTGHRRTNARSAGPMDQTGRHRPPKDAPYAKPSQGQGQGRGGNLSSRLGGSGGVELIPTRGPPRRAANLNHKRAPEGTPDVLKSVNPEHAQVQKKQHSKLNEVLKGDGIKQWLQSRLIQPGVLDMSNLPNDPWLKEQGLLPPGHRDAPVNAGHVFWKVIDSVLQQSNNTPIFTLSLAGNDFHTLHQLAKLPICLPYIRALDLSDNPISKIDELKHLQSPGEQKGKASTGAGSLKSLVELKLNGTKFRENMLQSANGGEQYQHDILRRFPGLLILDGVPLNRIVFPLERKPIVRRTEEERKPLRSQPFTYPFEIVPNFEENSACKAAVMSFCQKYFALFDNNRVEMITGYHHEATISIAANTLPSRSFQAQEVSRTRSSRPQPVPFEPWVSLPGRNFLRSCTTVEQRVKTLKSPMNQGDLITWWQKVPKTKHPLDDATKWCIDAWYLDNNVRICAVIQGEFQELPSGTFRSFTRTFVLGEAPEGSIAHANGWPAQVISEQMVVHSYLGTGTFDGKNSLARGDISIVPPPEGVLPVAVSQVQQQVLIEQVRQRTGMNAAFSELCLSQNGWDLERALTNFEAIRASIPAEVFAP